MLTSALCAAGGWIDGGAEMRVTNKTRKLLADIKKMCINREVCKTCPFWDKVLQCRLHYPYGWRIDDWKEYKEE